MQKSFVYILRDIKEKYYVGSTDNLTRRLKQHAYGHTQTTHKMKGFMLVFSQEYNSLTEARKAENKIKKLKRKDYVDKIVKDGYIKMAK